jgi:hypothetical protein
MATAPVVPVILPQIILGAAVVDSTLCSLQIERSVLSQPKAKPVIEPSTAVPLALRIVKGMELGLAVEAL